MNLDKRQLASILKVRTLTPNLPAGTVHRTRLHKALELNSDKNLILVSSPAGFGKTTLIVDFLTERRLSSAWVHVSVDMNNLYTFMNYLIDSLKNLNGEFGRNTAEVLEFCRENYQVAKHLKTIVNDIVGTFTNEFLHLFKDNITIVLDDLGVIGSSEWMIALMSMLMENIPPTMQIVITTRDIPNINMSQLMAKRKVFKLEGEDLRFSRGETAELLQKVYHTPCTEKELEALESNTGGWITGIHLILQAWGSAYPKLKIYNESVLEDIFTFFAEDIFKNLDEEIQNFLLGTALMEDFTAGAINRLLGANNSVQILNDLLNKNIFIQASPVLVNEDYEMIYSYQLLFKKFLVSKLHKTKNEKEIDTLLTGISGYYLEIKDYEKAVNFGLIRADREFAVNIIIEKFMDFYDGGMLNVLWKWLSAINEETVASNAYLSYYKSLLMKYYMGDAEGSLAYSDRAIDLFERNGLEQQMYKCIISKAGNLLSLGKVKEAITILKNVMNLKTNAENKAELLYKLSYAYYRNSQYDNSLTLLDEALTICIENNIRKIQTDIFNLFGHIYLIKGEYKRAVSYYERVVKRSFSSDDKLETLSNLALISSQTGSFEKAAVFLEDAGELAERIPIPIFKIAFLLAKQAYCFEFGDYPGAITLLEEMHNIAIKINHHYYIYLSRVLIADAYYYLNSLAKAEEYYESAFSYIDDENKLERNQYAFMKALLLKKQGISMQTSAAIGSIEEVLLDVFRYYEDNGSNYNLNQAAFHLADFYMKRGMGSPAKKYLADCLNKAKDKEYLSYLQREYMDSREVFDFAIANNIEKEFVKHIAHSVIDKSGLHAAEHPLKNNRENQLRLYYDVSVITFGGPEIYVRGKLIDENEWKKKKWKLALLYLLLSSKQSLTKDRIIDAFYPDTSPDSADNIFHQLVSRLRGLLRVDNILIAAGNGRESGHAKKNSKLNEGVLGPLHFLTYEDKTLKFSADFNIDIDLNRFEDYCKLSRSEKNHEKKIWYAKKAVELYKGEFLEGVYEPWSEDLRARLKRGFVSISEELISMLYAFNLHDEVIHFSDNLLSHDNLNEMAYLSGIRSLIKTEKLNSAREKYSLMLNRYADELGEKPPQKVLTQIEKLFASTINN